MGRAYRVGEVAAMTGVSVRTLHHYDRIGLLRPSGHSEGQHRRYAEADLLRLQQVLTLRALGFPLRRIGEVLAQPDFDLVASVWAQRRALRERAAALGRAEAALDALVEHRLATGRWDWDLVVAATAAAQDGIVKGGSVVEDLYTPEQMARFAEVGRRVPDDDRQALERGWATLLAEVRASRHLDPASAEARALADRWAALFATTSGFYRNDPELWDAIGEHHRAGRFADHPDAPQPEDWAFIRAVEDARGPDAGGD